MILSGAGHSNESDGLKAARLATHSALGQATLTQADLVFVFVTHHHLEIAQLLVQEVMEVAETVNVVGSDFFRLIAPLKTPSNVFHSPQVTA